MSRITPLFFFVALAACDGAASLNLWHTGPGDGDAPGAPDYVSPGRAQLRLLSATEYRSSVEDLLGVTASPALAHANRVSGYETGANGQVDENLHAVLMSEAERLGEAYVGGRLAIDFPCFDPGNVTAACVETVIRELGRRMFRRPVPLAVQDELFDFFDDVANVTGDRVTATGFVVARMLASPQFLYRTEVGQTLDAFQKATFLAYAVTGSTPDEVLLLDAENDALTPARIREHVARLLDSPKGRARFADFVQQWLRAGALETMAAHPEGYAKLSSPEQGAALRDELDRYVEAVVIDGAGTLPALLGESATFVNRHTAPLYGLRAKGDTLTRVALDPKQRRGVFTLASTLAAHGSSSDPGRDRPVKRGLLVFNRVMCGQVMGPPSGLNTATASSNAAERVPNFAELTTREQYTAMMEQGAECAGCHRQFMPIGFAFGGYDALGRRVTAYGGRTIDTHVDLPSGSFADALALEDALIADPATARCFARNLVVFTTGAGIGRHVDELSAVMGEHFLAHRQDIKALLADLLSSPHLYRRAIE